MREPAENKRKVIRTGPGAWAHRYRDMRISETRGPLGKFADPISEFVAIGLGSIHP